MPKVYRGFLHLAFYAFRRYVFHLSYAVGLDGGSLPGASCGNGPAIRKAAKGFLVAFRVSARTREERAGTSRRIPMCRVSNCRVRHPFNTPFRSSRGWLSASPTLCKRFLSPSRLFREIEIPFFSYKRGVPPDARWFGFSRGRVNWRAPHIVNPFALPSVPY